MIDIKAMRKALGLNQAQMANKVGVTPQMISLLEHGMRTPSVDVAKRIALVLGFDWTLFYENSHAIIES